MSLDHNGDSIEGGSSNPHSQLIKKFTYDRLFQIKKDYNDLKNILENITKFGISTSDLDILLTSSETSEDIKDVACHESISLAAKVKTALEIGLLDFSKIDRSLQSPPVQPKKTIKVGDIRNNIFGLSLPSVNPSSMPANYPPPLPVIEDDSILKNVFIHSSAANDPSFEVEESNERLEFLGDSVLNHIISVLIFAKFPDFNEGDLTVLRSEIVCNKNLTLWSTMYGLDRQLVSNLNTLDFERAHKKVFADTFEAYVGGVYQDSKGDINKILPWLSALVEPSLAKVQERPTMPSTTASFLTAGSYPSMGSYASTTATSFKRFKSETESANDLNSKTSKQELYVILNPMFVPQYEVLKKENSDHDPSFTVLCVVNGEVLGVGRSKNVKIAGQMSAFDALHNNRAKVDKYNAIRNHLKQTSGRPPERVRVPYAIQLKSYLD